MFYKYSFVLVVAALLAGCGNVSRLDRDEVVDYSGGWNDTDSRLVAEEMSGDALSRPWKIAFAAKNGRKPAVIVGDMLNRSDEHINMDTFTLEVERSLINSGEVIFVANSQERQGIRGEREDQAINSSADTRKAARQERGADFMLIGTVNTIVDPKNARTQLRYYQVNMQLVSLLDNTTVWIGQKEIKKNVKDARIRG